ncbi:MAG: PEGA domain-containing protein [Alkalispirochaetaceae bacterium]
MRRLRICFTIGVNAPGAKALLLAALFVLPAVLAAGEELDLPETTVLIVEVEPEEARILIDNDYAGTGRIERTGVLPGSYKIEARLPGYYSETRFVTLREGSRTEVSIDLDQIVGFLDVRSRPADALVSVGETRIESFPAELPVGIYDVRIRAFGYREVTRRVVIAEERRTTLSVELDEAPFEILRYQVRRPRFNPRNPGSVGTTAVEFEVSAPGSGEVEVVGPEGEVILRRQLEEFTSWNQAFVWDGRAPGGAPLPQGVYTIALYTRGRSLEENGEVLASRAAEVTIDPGVISRFRSLFSGSSGLLYLPLAEPVGAGTAQVSTEGFLYNSASDSWYSPLAIGARFALGAPSEFSFTLAPLLSSRAAESRVGLTGAFSWRYYTLPGRLSLGLVTRGAIDTPVNGSFGGRDERSAPSGISLQSPVTVYLGRFLFGVSGELHVGIDPVEFEPEAEGGEPSLWSYLRAGVGYDGEILSLGLSAALRSAPLDEELDRLGPLALGSEARLLLPETPLYISLLAAGDLYPRDERFVLKGGFGAGVLF